MKTARTMLPPIDGGSLRKEVTAMSTAKKAATFRLSDEAWRCLDELEHNYGCYRSRTDIVEQAIIHELERRREDGYDFMY